MSQRTRSRRRGQLVLFHVTPRINLESIYKHGIDPEFALNPSFQVCWFVSASQRMWAIRHVADKFHLKPSQLVCIRVILDRRSVVRRRRGVWTCAAPVSEFVSVSPVSNVWYTTFGVA